MGAKHVVTKSSKNLARKKVSMLTGLKVSSLTCKCVFYRTEHNAKWGSHGTEFWKPRNEENKFILSSYHVYFKN